MKKYEIEMKLPSLNEYINVCRSNKYQAAKYKAQIEAEIGLFLMKMPKWDNSIRIHFTWVEGTKKRDFDNVCFSKKFILDAMQKYGKLENDNRKWVTGFTDDFEYGKETKVILEIEEVEPMKERIISYMKEFGSITTFDAFIDLGCSRLSEYIRQIRQSYVVNDEWITTTNRYGEKVKYKKFWLAD